MKTKALLAAGLLMAATAASSVAQTVYSVNAVGFVNVTCPPGFTIIANPLSAATNTVQALMPSSLPFLSSVFKFDPIQGGFVSSVYLNNGNWTANNLSLIPGEGFFFKNPAATNITLTFVGNVMQGNLTNSLPQGFSLVSSQVPQQGLVSTDLGLPVAFLDAVFRFNGVGYVSSVVVNAGNPPTTPPTFTGGEPTINVGEGFFVKKQSSAVNWTRVFSVNN